MTDENTPIAELPERLRTVVESAAQGHADKEIASRMGLSVHTVDTHWRRLREIFDAANRAETIAKYLASRHQGDQQEAAERHADLEREVVRLRQELTRTKAALRERDAASVRMFEDAARVGWQDTHERERLLRLERVVDSGGTFYYEGEIGGLWRKHWATDNLREYGYSAQDFVDGTLRVADIIPPEDLLASIAAFETAIATGVAYFVTHYRIRRADGEWCWVRDRMSILRNEAGIPVAYYGAVVDVSDLIAHIDPVTLVEFFTPEQGAK